MTHGSVRRAVIPPACPRGGTGQPTGRMTSLDHVTGYRTCRCDELPDESDIADTGAWRMHSRCTVLPSSCFADMVAMAAICG
jgi:hypothetical protein